MAVAVAEVVCTQDIEQVGLFLRSLKENRSRLDLQEKNGQVALESIYNGLENAKRGFPTSFLKVLLPVF